AREVLGIGHTFLDVYRRRLRGKSEPCSARRRMGPPPGSLPPPVTAAALSTRSSDYSHYPAQTTAKQSFFKRLLSVHAPRIPPARNPPCARRIRDSTSPLECPPSASPARGRLPASLRPRRRSAHRRGSATSDRAFARARAKT